VAENDIKEVEERVERIASPPAPSAIKVLDDKMLEHRFFIARWLTWLYCGAVGATAAYLIIRGFCFSDKSAFQDLFELIKVALLPVITLMLGFYFASSRP
jgi:hypothetical protein